MRDGIPERPYKRLHHAGQNEQSQRDSGDDPVIREQPRHARARHDQEMCSGQWRQRQ